MASTLQQFHSRLSVPSAVCTTDSFSAGTTQESFLRTPSMSACSSSNMLKNPLRSQVDCTSRRRSLPYGCGSCAASSSSTMEPPRLSYTTAMKPATLYDVLGISDMVTDDEIKAAFRRMAKEVHPDQAPPDQVEEYQEKFKSVYRAYSVLKDPRTRSLYNYEISNTTVYSRPIRFADGLRPAWRGCNWETDQCW